LQAATAKQVSGAAKLAKKETRSETGLFLLEGPQGLKEALDQPDKVVEVFFTPEAALRHGDLLAGALAAKLSVLEATEKQIKTISDTTQPQGIVTVCKQLDVSLDAIFKAAPKLLIVLSQVRDPGNAGTVLRAADAAGADAVIFTANSVDPYNPKVVRSTTGSLFHVPMSLGADLEEVTNRAKAAGIQVFAAAAGSVTLTDLPDGTLAKPTAWIFGNEAWGLSPEEHAMANQTVSVPIYGDAESLNLATAASVCIYASAMSQRGNG
jgi:TrmH family RNA methyltransferase